MNKETAKMNFHTKARGRLFLVLAAALLGGVLAAAFAAPAIADVSDFDFDSVSASISDDQAGAHPDFTTTFIFNGDEDQSDGSSQPLPWGSMRNVSIKTPAGLVGNPAGFPTCSVAALMSFNLQRPEYAQPLSDDSQIGTVDPGLWICSPRECSPSLSTTFPPPVETSWLDSASSPSSFRL